MSIKIIITDDHPLIVSGLQTILQSSKQIEVIATYFSGNELLEGLKERQPDVLLTDLQMPGKIFGMELIKIIRKSYPRLPILILSGQEAIYNVQDMMKQGCMGYLLKNTTNQKMLVDAIETVYKGELFLEPSLKNELLHDILIGRKDNQNTAGSISRREKEVLNLIAKGHSSQEIAEKLYLSIRTIDSHRMSLLQKLNVKNSTALLRKAIDLGLVK